MYPQKLMWSILAVNHVAIYIDDDDDDDDINFRVFNIRDPEYIYSGLDQSYYFIGQRENN